MNTRTKKILWVSLGMVAAIAIAGWYFFPIYMYRLSYQNDDLKMKYLGLKPRHVDNLAVPPQDWSNIKLGGISLKIPLYRFNKIEGSDTSLSLRSDSEMLSISDLAPSQEMMEVIKQQKLKYPLLSFQERIAVLTSLPTDVSLHNSRKHNMEGFKNQILKFLSVTTGGWSEIYIYNSNNLKAIAAISERREKSDYSANVEVYSQKEKAYFSMMLMKYKDREALKNDLEKLLGGVSVSDQPNDLAVAKNDINTFVNQYGRSQPAPRPAVKAGRSGL